jgi:hypothetical protein
MLYEKQLSYGVRVVQHMFYSAPQATLDGRVHSCFVGLYSPLSSIAVVSPGRVHPTVKNVSSSPLFLLD